MPIMFHPFRWFKKRIKPVKTALAGPDLHSLLNGYRSTALIYIAAKLKLSDLLAKGPRTSADLASTLDVHARSLQRLLRGLVILGLCTEEDDGRFRLTRLGARLQSNNGGSEYSLAIMNGEEYAPAWNHLLHSIRTGETAFDHVFGQSPWEHRRATSGLNDCFNTWLKNGATKAGRSLLSAHDFSVYRRIADLGGGNGSLLVTLLQAQPATRGILFDQAHVLATARTQLEAGGVDSRCQLVEGNFFERIPEGADVCILKSILHDWDDEKSLTILRNCHAALQPGQPLLVLEKILPEPAASAPMMVMDDLHMLAVTGGLERTADEYGKLFRTAGFQLKKIVPLRTGHSLLETVRV